MRRELDWFKLRTSNILTSFSSYFECVWFLLLLLFLLFLVCFLGGVLFYVYLCAVSVVSLLLQHKHIRTVQIVSIIIKQILFWAAFCRQHPLQFSSLPWLGRETGLSPPLANFHTGQNLFTPNRFRLRPRWGLCVMASIFWQWFRYTFQDVFQW